MPKLHEKDAAPPKPRCAAVDQNRCAPLQEPSAATEHRIGRAQSDREFARIKRALRKAERRAGDGTEIGGTGATILKFRGAPLARLADKKRIGSEELRAAEDIAIAF